MVALEKTMLGKRSPVGMATQSSDVLMFIAGCI